MVSRPASSDEGDLPDGGAGGGERALPHPLEAVLFDLDGTLLEIGSGSGGSSLRAGDGATPAPGGWARRLWVSTETPLNYAIAYAERLGLERAMAPGVRVARRIKGIASEDESRLVEGAGELVAALAGRFRLGVVTSRSRRAATRILERTGLRERIPVLISRSDVWRLKPHPDAILRAVAQLGVRVERTLMVGDLPVDVRAARRARVYALGVTTGFGSEAELLAAGADRVAPSVLALGALLGDAAPQACALDPAPAAGGRRLGESE